MEKILWVIIYIGVFVGFFIYGFWTYLKRTIVFYTSLGSIKTIVHGPEVILVSVTSWCASAYILIAAYLIYFDLIPDENLMLGCFFAPLATFLWGNIAVSIAYSVVYIYLKGIKKQGVERLYRVNGEWM